MVKASPGLTLVDSFNAEQYNHETHSVCRNGACGTR